MPFLFPAHIDSLFSLFRQLSVLQSCAKPNLMHEASQFLPGDLQLVKTTLKIHIQFKDP